MRYKNRMNTKNLMVSFVAIAMALFLVATVSADVTSVTVDGIEVYDGAVVTSLRSVTAGETITVKVYFDYPETMYDVTIKAELDGVEVKTKEFNAIEGADKKILNIKVPYDFEDDELDKKLELEITVEGEDFEEILPKITLNVQRPKYNVDFKSINVAQNIEAGETFPVDIIVKNTGFDDLKDLFVTARISALDIEQRFYFGDLVDAKEDSDSTDDDVTDTLHKRFYLTVPYDVASGEYTLKVEVSNDDAVLSKTVIVDIKGLPNQVFKTENGLMIINPTDKIAVYTVVVESPASVSRNVVSVEAGKSETIIVTPNAEGEYNFNVSVFNADGKLVRTVTFSGSEEVSQLASPIVILTVILAIIFLVLLVVLIVLVTKKPEKTEEFGESYY